MKSVNWSKPGYASITCSTISNIPYNLIFTTKYNDSSILITIFFHVTIWICRWRMNTLVTLQYQPRLSSITIIVCRGHRGKGELQLHTLTTPPRHRKHKNTGEWRMLQVKEPQQNHLGLLWINLWHTQPHP